MSCSLMSNVERKYYKSRHLVPPHHHPPTIKRLGVRFFGTPPLDHSTIRPSGTRVVFLPPVSLATPFGMLAALRSLSAVRARRVGGRSSASGSQTVGLCRPRRRKISSMASGRLANVNPRAEWRPQLLQHCGSPRLGVLGGERMLSASSDGLQRKRTLLRVDGVSVMQDTHKMRLCQSDAEQGPVPEARLRGMAAA